ncbi:MAG: NAD(P)H-dependent glycerol-3-phosphate dehydrogenase [Bacilli bacterium]
MNVTIIGAGSWGCALANVLSNNHHSVILYDINQHTVDEINTLHCNSLVPNATLNEDIMATTDLQLATSHSSIIVLSVPTKVIRGVLERISEQITEPKLFVNTSKGLEPNTFKRVSEIVSEIIPSSFLKGFVALTGPSHAEEVIINLPTTICSVSENSSDASFIQHLFSNHQNFRVYTGNDLIGSELCGSIKNVYAIASGLLEGMGYGDNARAGLISRALVEMRRIVTLLGGKEETLYGLTGIGDLVVTTTSHHSRNFQAGVKLASGKSLDETIASMPMTVEGARTALAVHELAIKYNLDTPIINEVYNVIYHKKPVKDAVHDLFKRALKEEN